MKDSKMTLNEAINLFISKGVIVEGSRQVNMMRNLAQGDVNAVKIEELKQAIIVLERRIITLENGKG